MNKREAKGIKPSSKSPSPLFIRKNKMLLMVGMLQKVASVVRTPVEGCAQHTTVAFRPQERDPWRSHRIQITSIYDDSNYLVQCEKHSASHARISAKKKRKKTSKAITVSSCAIRRFFLVPYSFFWLDAGGRPILLVHLQACHAQPGRVADF